MRLRIIVGVLLAGTVTAARQSAVPPADQPPTTRFGAATAGVVVDVVVRDKRGRPVEDLRQDEFEIFEDDVPQRVIAFEPYTPSDAPLTVADAAAAAGVLPNVHTTTRRLAEGPPVIALAWDRLGPESRGLAHRAAKRLVETKAPGELVGIFLTDMTLYTLQPYTTDGAKLAAAVEDLATRATSALDREPSPLDSLVGRAQTSPTASASEGGFGLAGFPQGGAQGGSEGDQTNPAAQGSWPGLVAMLQRMERSYTQFLYEAQGRASMLGLLALVDSLGQLPGRKTLFYFCEGLTIPDSQQARFRAVIDTANRNNVSVYTFDSAGLRVHSAQQQTAREVRELGAAGLGAPSTRSPKRIESLEDNERLLKMDPAVSLGILADQTGGVLVNNTNALDRAIDRINEDRRHHYLLSYVSTNTALDGAYRRIDVKVKRRDVEVRARRGYRAIAPGIAAPILDYETGALAAIAAIPRPTAFPVQTRALSVPMPGRPGMTAIIAGFAGDAVTVTEDLKLKSYAGEATVLVRVTDATGGPVVKQSQHYQLTGQLAELPKMKAGNLLFFRTPELPPGEFIVTTAVHDGKGKRSSVVDTKIEIPVGTGSVVGSLFVVTRAERLDPKDTSAASHPLAGNGVLLYPSFGEPLSRKAQPEIAFALPIVVEPGSPPPTATLELLQKGQPLAQLPLPLDKPDSTGRLLQVSRLPSAAIPPGNYELRITVIAGAGKSVRTTPLTVVE
jgi:VWFA-related protein